MLLNHFIYRLSTNCLHKLTEGKKRAFGRGKWHRSHGLIMQDGPELNIALQAGPDDVTSTGSLIGSTECLVETRRYQNPVDVKIPTPVDRESISLFTWVLSIPGDYIAGFFSINNINQKANYFDGRGKEQT